MTKAISLVIQTSRRKRCGANLNTAWEFVRSNFDFRSGKIRSKDKERVFNLTPEEESGR
jgi:hypothetical protein